MEFGSTDFERVVAVVHAHVERVPDHVAQLRSAAVVAGQQWWVPPQVASAMAEVAEVIARNAEQIAVMVGQLLEGVAAPVLLFGYAGQWVGVKGAASDVQGVLRPDQLPVRAHWKGLAADRYATAVSTQSGAAGRIAATAQTATTALGACALAGSAFYVALGVILVRLTGSLITAIAAFGSEVFSWAGVLLVVEESGVALGLVITAVSTLTALLGSQVVTVNSLRSELVDHSQFPGGRWPRAVADTYADATVTDGDAKWSVVP